MRSAPHKPYNTVTHTGLWRTLLVKESHRTHEVQVILGMSKNYEQALQDGEASKFKKLLQEIEEGVLGLKREESEEKLVTSLYYAYCDSHSGTFTPGSDVY